MNNRNFQYNEWAGPNTSLALFATAALTPTWNVGDRYLIIGTVAVGDDATSFSVIMYINAGDIIYDHYISPRDPTNDMYSCPMIFPYTVMGSELLEIYVDSDGSSPSLGSTARQASINVFKLLDNDQTNADYLSAGSSTSGTGSFETVAGSTVTIAKTGEYLVLACARVGKGELTANFDIRLAHNTTGYGQQTMRAVSTTKFFPWAHMVKLTLTAGDTLTIEHRSTTTGVTSTALASIVALYLDDFPNALEIEDTADATVAVAGAGSWFDHGNMNNVYALQPYKALLLSCCQYRRAGASVDASVRTQYDGTTVQESRNESVVSNGEATHFCAKALDPATGGQHKFVQQLQNHGTGLTSAFISDGATAVLQMNNNATMRIRGASQVFGNAKMGL